MPHPARTTNRPIGVGLATCLLSVVILSMLGYAVAKSRWPATPAKIAERQRDTSTPTPELDPVPAAPPTTAPEPDQISSLQPWPTMPVDLLPPVYEQPYAPALPPDAAPILLPNEEPIPDPFDEATPAVEPPPTPTLPPIESVTDEPAEPFAAPVEQDAVSSSPAGEAPAGEAIGDGAIGNRASGDEATEPTTVDFDAPSILFSAPPMVEAKPVDDGPEDAADNDTEQADTDALADAASDPGLDDLLVDTPAASEIARLAAGDVREAFTLGSNGALFAARSRFIAVLRRIAVAKDAADNTKSHSQALATGLRAIEEAVAFEPQGDALETDLDVPAIAASHTTPLYRDDDLAGSALPHEAIARYHRYAVRQLSKAVAGDQAGSMALHGLGKTYARLADLDEAPLAARTSLAMYRAAVAAHPGNFLAANELGVGLAKAGRYAAAEAELQRAIATGGPSTVYRNLAQVQAKLGRARLALAARQRADQLAAGERTAGAFSRARGVQWVPPRDFARVADATGQTPSAGSPPPALAGPAPPQPESRPSSGGWRLPIVSRVAQRLSAPEAAPLTNPTAPPVRSQTIVR